MTESETIAQAYSLLAGLMDELRAAQRQISDLKSEAAQAQSHMLITQAESLTGGTKLLAAEVANMDAKSLQVRLAATAARGDEQQDVF